jgi:hypothetical protein
LHTGRRIVGWRVRGSENGWIFFANRERAESFADERNEILQECYSDGTVATIWESGVRALPAVIMEQG